MSWIPKIFVLSVLGAVCVRAERVYFTGDPEATVKTRIALSRGGLANGELPSLDIEFHLPFVDITKNADGFDEVQAKGLLPLSTPGYPDLAATGVLLAVPEGFDAQVNVLSIETRELSNIVVAPAQRNCRCSDPSNDLFVFHSNFYRSNGVYPEHVVAVETVGNLQEVPIKRVGIQPLRADMGRQSLQVTTHLKLRVQFQRLFRSKPVVLSNTFYQILRSLVVNGATLNDVIVEANQAETMLVFTADALKDSLTALLDWKKAKGIKLELFTLSQVGGTNEKLKSFLQQYYDSHSPKPTYVLFVGNAQSMPPFSVSTGSDWISGKASSDYPFSLLSGNDIIPDLLYGRLVADNSGEVQTQINRWIAYEKTPEATGSWYPRGVTIASAEGSGPSDREYAEMVANSLKTHTYDSVDAVLEAQGPSIVSSIAKNVDEGRSWLTYFGHGSGLGWGWNTLPNQVRFDVESVAKLQNHPKLPVIIDVACENARYVPSVSGVVQCPSTRYPECFGKAWVNRAQQELSTGAVAFYGGTVSISWHPPAIMAVGVAKYHFEKRLSSLGASVLAGQMHLVEKMGTGSQVTDNLKWYALFGDPSLLMRTDTPKTYKVNTQVTEEPNRVQLNIKAIHNDGTGAAGLLTSLKSSNTNELLGVATTDNTGLAKLEVPGIGQLEPNTLLTVTGYNAETQQLVIP